jgi:hypothetical protein
MSRYDEWKSANCRKLDELTKHPLFVSCLLPDIKQGFVFPAIRKSRIDFYYLGQKLCSFKNRQFQTNVAYLAAFQNRPQGEVTEAQFRQLKPCESFKDGYMQIKKNIKLFERDESGGVFDLCRHHSCYASSFIGPIGVFDIELSFEANEEGRTQDRIDLVLFHASEKKLRFFEVKTFANKEIWPGYDGNVAVCEQINRYRMQLRNRHASLLADYKEYVALMNRLCGVTLPEPIALDDEPDLLLIGFDKVQLQKINQLLVPAMASAFKCCLIGNPDRATQGTLNSWWTNRHGCGALVL